MKNLKDELPKGPSGNLWKSMNAKLHRVLGSNTLKALNEKKKEFMGRFHIGPPSNPQN